MLKCDVEPTKSEKIIGFYGRSDWGRGFSGIQEFGIITAPINAELPANIYDLPELQNTDGGNGPVSCYSDYMMSTENKIYTNC